MAVDPLSAEVLHYEPTVSELAYNYFTDRKRMELPEPGDPAASGSVYGILWDNDFGKKARIAATRELDVAETVRLVGGIFTGTVLDTGMWSTSYNSGTGAAVMASGVCQLSTGSTSNSGAFITTQKLARYLSTTLNYVRVYIQVPNGGSVNNICRWGAFDLSEGYFYALNGTSLSMVSRMAGVDTVWPLPVAFQTINSNWHHYDIWWDDINAWFFMEGNLVGTIKASASVLTTTLHFKASAQCINTNGNTGNNTMNIRSLSIARLGEQTSSEYYKNISTNGVFNLKYGPGNVGTFLISKSGTSANVVTLYDGISTASGTEICTLNTYTNVGMYSPINVDFSGGLTVAASGGNAGDFTITWE